MLVRITKEDPEKEECRESASVIRILPGLWRHSFDSRTSGLSSYNSELHHLPEFFDIPVPVDKNNYRILLMTDALAHYVIDMEERGMSVVNHLLSLSTQEDFARYVDRCRETGLANDDTTLVVVEIVNTTDSTPSDIKHGDFDGTKLPVIDDTHMLDRNAYDNDQDSLIQSNHPSLDRLPHALPSSSYKSTDAKTSISDIYSEHEPIDKKPSSRQACLPDFLSEKRPEKKTTKGEAHHSTNFAIEVIRQGSQRLKDLFRSQS